MDIRALWEKGRAVMREIFGLEQTPEVIELKREVLREAVGLFPRGKWHSANPKDKETPWYVSVADGQAAGKVDVGTYVWVSKSRSAFQLVEVLKAEGTHTDKEGLKRSLFSVRIVSEI